MEVSEIIIFVIFGMAGGFLSGLLGVGGGIIFIPVFDFLFKSKGIDALDLPRFILANSFLAILFSGFISSFKHYRSGNFFHREVVTIALPATIFGLTLSYLITSFSWYSEEVFKTVFLTVIVATIWRTWLSHKRNVQNIEPPFVAYKYGIIGVLTGVISAFSGLGGGVAMIPLLTLFGKIDIKKASAISISVIPLMIIPSLFIYAMATPTVLFKGGVGYLQFLFIIPIIVGIFMGSPLGVLAATVMNSRSLQGIFIGLLIIIAVKYGINLFL
ncbi:MAG: putative membrane protein YfcA [Bacteroidia bacterium]